MAVECGRGIVGKSDKEKGERLASRLQGRVIKAPALLVLFISWRAPADTGGQLLPSSR